MTETRGEQRAETARRNDDSDIIEAALEESLGGEVHSGRSGGNLKLDVATQTEEESVFDPEARERVTKGDQISHGQHSDEPHPPERELPDRE